MDHPIVQAGIAKLGGHGDQCYIFARDAVATATGMQIGKGYRQRYLDAGGIEVDAVDAEAGDILQISNPSDPGAYYHGMHTAIVIENFGDGTYRVTDSNSHWDEVVRIREWRPQPAQHLRLYAYRFTPPQAPAAAFRGGEIDEGRCLPLLERLDAEWPALLSWVLGLHEGSLCERIGAESQP